MTAPAADLFARAIIAAAISYGDDPVEAVTSRRCNVRRALTAAGAGLSEATGLTLKRVSAVLGVTDTAITHARFTNKPQFWKAARAAEDAARAHLKIHPLSLAPTPATPKRRGPGKKALAAAAAVRAPARPTAKEAGQTVGWATPDKVLKRGVETAPDATVTDPFAALRPRRPPAPGDRGEPGPLPQAAAVIMPSPRCASRTVGAPAPLKGEKNPHGDNPADIGARQAEARFVREKRAAGVPWAHIARQTGVSETTLRQRYDLSFQAVG